MKSNPEKSRHLPRKGEGASAVQQPDAALPGGWILPSVGAPSSPSRAVGEEDSRRPGAAGVEVMKEARRVGPGRGWRVARALPSPEPGAQLWGQGGAAEEAVLPPSPAFTPGRAAAGARGRVCALPGLDFSFFLAGQSYGIPSSPQARGQSGSALAREPSARRCVLASRSARGSAGPFGWRPVGSPP